MRAWLFAPVILLVGWVVLPFFFLKVLLFLLVWRLLARLWWGRFHYAPRAVQLARGPVDRSGWDHSVWPGPAGRKGRRIEIQDGPSGYQEQDLV